MVFRYAVWILVAVVLFGLAAPVMASEAGGHDAKDALNPLSWNDLKSELAIFTAVIFVILLFVLKKFAWGPIAEGLDKREQRVRGEIEAAQQANLEAKELLAQHQQRLAAAESDVRELLERARREAERTGREIVEKARGETEAEKQRALREIDVATAGALKDLAERSANLAVELAGRIVGSRLDAQSHSRLIEEAVGRFAKSSPNGGPSAGQN
jgi:F-type H+-transporting ATPase subunit b